MTTSVNFVEPLEFGQALLAELQAAGENTNELFNFLKGNVVCDFSGVPELLRTPSMRAAAAALVEKNTPSFLATREDHTATFYINSDDLSGGRTNYFMSGPTAINDANTGANTYSRASAPIWFNQTSLGAEGSFVPALPAVTQITGAARGARAVSGAGRVKDITLATGTYRLSFVGLLAGFSFVPGLWAEMPSPTLYKFTAFDAMLSGVEIPMDTLAGYPVDIIAKIGNVYKTIATIMHYPSDHRNGRNRLISGSDTVSVTQPTVMTLFMQRCHARGLYTKLSDSSVKTEAVGFNKSIVTIPGSSFPTRDAYNYLQVMRIA